MAIARRKFNEDLTNSTEVVHRKVITDAEDIDDCVRDLWSFMDGYPHHFRVYLSVNARDVVSAFFTFRSRTETWVDQLVHGNDNMREKMGRVGSEWKSVLHSPESKDDSYFLFDFDNTSEAAATTFQLSLEEETEVHRTIATPNGWHFITDPFNYTTWEPPHEYDELDTDGQVFIAEVT